MFTQGQSVCHICKSTLLEISDFSIFSQVTSDCRLWKKSGHLAVCNTCGIVQKPVNKISLQDVGVIYSEYEVYSQSGGIDQSTFDPLSGYVTSRSMKLVEWLITHYNISVGGRILDIGCGNGAFLHAFASSCPGWLITGLDLDDRSRAILEKIPGFEALHIGFVNGFAQHFDIISLIHTLEHIPDPINFLGEVKNKLLPGGVLLIETPNLTTSPFDILIADHCSHFTANALKYILEQALFDVIFMQEDYIDKEVTVLAQAKDFGRDMISRENTKNKFIIDVTETTDIVFMHINYLKSLCELANSICGEIGIFGTSIAGTWLAGCVIDKVKFFVDEDINQQGRYHLGKPIISPSSTKRGDLVMLPFSPDTALKIARRLSHCNCCFVLPPLHKPSSQVF